jgi:hypothetical protein
LVLEGKKRRRKMENQSQVRALVKTSFKLGDSDYVSIELEVTDQVRPGVDKNTAAAVDRVYGLVQDKVAEKAQKFIDKV